MTEKVLWFGNEKSLTYVDGTIDNGRPKDAIEFIIWNDGDVTLEHDVSGYSYKVTVTLESLSEIVRMGKLFMENKERVKK